MVGDISPPLDYIGVLPRFRISTPPSFLPFLVQLYVTLHPPYEQEGVSGCPDRPPSRRSALDPVILPATPTTNSLHTMPQCHY